MASIFASLGRRAEKKALDDEDDQTEAEKLRKAKRKAKSEDSDEDDDEEGGDKDREDEKDAKASANRARERARVRAILTSGPGLANPVAAAHMALDTDMPRSKAIATIDALNVATGARDAHEAEVEFNEQPDVAMANAILAAGAKARAEKPRAVVPPGQRPRVELRPGQEQSAPKMSMVDRILAAGRKARGEA